MIISATKATNSTQQQPESRPDIHDLIKKHYPEFSGVHPACLAVPEASDDDFEQLRKDIRTQGIREPLLRLPSGELIDGRTRLQVCYLESSEFRVENVAPNLDPWALAWTLNGARRHLEVGQRAMFGLKWVEHDKEIAKERQLAMLRQSVTSVKETFPEREEAGQSRDKTGERVSVSGKSIEKAKVIQQQLPAVAAQVASGAITLEAGFKQARQHQQQTATRPAEAAPPRLTTPIITASGVMSAIQQPQRSVFNRTTDAVDWASWTWNPVTGCNHGCGFCYAREIANSERMKAFYPNGFEPTFHEYRLPAPSNTPVPKSAIDRDGRVFVCSMADLFGKWVPDEWIQKVFAACLAAPTWEYLFLTKWPARYSQMPLIEKAWYGASIIQQSDVERVTTGMQKIPGKPIRWISMEPMLEPIVLSDLSWCDLVVIGSQTSTNQPQPIGFVPAFAPQFDWIVDIVNQCRSAGVPYYLKANLGLENPGMTLPKSSPRR